MEQVDQNLLRQLADKLAEEPELLFAVAFGSVTTGQERIDSDIDIGVLADKPLTARRREDLIRKIARIAGRPVDLVDLRTAGVAVLRSALVHGHRLFVRDRRAVENLHARMITDAEDFLPYHQRMLRERRARWIN